ncbi:TraM recognition domain-containing protein [Actinomycetes bacterium KLBMP 9759]
MNLWTFVLLGASALTAQIAWRRGARALALAAGGFAVLLGWAVVREAHPIVALALVAAAAAGAWQRWGRSSAIVARWGHRSRRTSGMATRWDIFRYRGAFAMRRRAATMRPSLRTTGVGARVRQLLRLPVTEVAVLLCKTGGVRVWSACEEVELDFGGPRKGKSQDLAGSILDAPGAVVATSTRLDLLDQVGSLRAERGPVFVFNPVGLGGRESTISFDPLIRCTDPVTAMERATDMIGAGQMSGASGDREFWDEQGRRVLAALMHAAALGGLSLDTVQDWLADLDGYEQDITRLLRDHSTEPGFVAAITQFIRTNDRTRTSITSTIAPALGWLTHPPARAAARSAADGGHAFDVQALLDSRALVFLVGGEEAQVTPLVCALTGFIAREARRLAAFQPGGRLDPPLALRLDECALICPVPLHHWTADMGGRGVNIKACFQSRAQLIDRYGPAKAAAIMNNAGSRKLYGGTADRDDLEYWSALAGQRDEWVPSLDANGRTTSRHLRRVPVLPVERLAILPPSQVVVYTSDIPPVIGWAEQAWRRRDVHAHHNPNALTVRARAALARRRATVKAWAWEIAEPVITWGAEGTRAVDAAIAAALVAFGRWVRSEWRDLRHRIFGIATPPPYTPPKVAPRLTVAPKPADDDVEWLTGRPPVLTLRADPDEQWRRPDDEPGETGRPAGPGTRDDFV